MKAKTASAPIFYNRHHPWTPSFFLPHHSSDASFAIPQNTVKSLTGLREYSPRHGRWDAPHFPIPFFCC